MKLYEKQQTSLSVDPNFSRMLRIHERKLSKRHMEGLKQRDLRDWLGRGGVGGRYSVHRFGRAHIGVLI
jgi:hypothetical protein